MPIYPNISGTTKAINSARDCYINVGGAWKQCSQVYVNVDGTWKRCFQQRIETQKTAHIDYLHYRHGNEIRIYNVKIGSTIYLTGYHYTGDAVNYGIQIEADGASPSSNWSGYFANSSNGSYFTWTFTANSQTVAFYRNRWQASISLTDVTVTYIEEIYE